MWSLSFTSKVNYISYIRQSVRPPPSGWPPNLMDSPQTCWLTSNLIANPQTMRSAEKKSEGLLKGLRLAKKNMKQPAKSECQNKKVWQPTIGKRMKYRRTDKSTKFLPFYRTSSPVWPLPNKDIQFSLLFLYSFIFLYRCNNVCHGLPTGSCSSTKNQP